MSYACGGTVSWCLQWTMRAVTDADSYVGGASHETILINQGTPFPCGMG